MPYIDFFYDLADSFGEETTLDEAQTRIKFLFSKAKEEGLLTLGESWRYYHTKLEDFNRKVEDKYPHIPRKNTFEHEIWKHRKREA